MASVEDFESAGLYDAAAPESPDRLALLEWLDDRGCTIEEMQRAHSLTSVGLVSLATDRRLLRGELLTRVAAIELSGLSAQVFDRMSTALGFAPIDQAPEGEIGFTADDAAMFAGLHTFMAMFSNGQGIEVVRVIGSSMARIAEASVSLFLQNVESPHVNAGGSELVQAQQSYEAVGRLDSGFAGDLDALLRRHTVQAVERTRSAATGTEERFDYRYAIGFVDLVGFTSISATMSPRELGAFLGDFEGRAHDAAIAAGARVVKLMGDEVMLASTDPDAACHAADALMSGFDFGGDHVHPRAGLAYGNVLLRGADYYGSIVNLASRLVDQAAPGELLASAELAAATSRWHFRPAGTRTLKGFLEPVRVSSYSAV